MVMLNPISLFALMLCISLNLLGVSPAFAASTPAADLDHGGQLFSANCAACHMGGGNVLRANRSLRMRDLNAHLDQYNKDPLIAIEQQIEDGKDAMPSYAGKLSESEIIAVATYVEQQAEQGW